MSDPDNATSRRENLFGATVVVAAVSLLISVLAVGFGMRAIDEADNGGGGGGGAAPATASVVLKEFSITPASITVGAGGSLNVTNEGTVQHDVAVKGNDAVKIPLLDAGKSNTLDLSTLSPGDYTIYCTVPGHEAAGMHAQLTIAESAGAAGGAIATTTTALDAEAMDKAARARTAAFPAATKGTGGQLLEPTVLADGTKQYDLTVDSIDWEVEPGKVVKALAYNKQIPGPTLKVNDGDRIKVVVENNLDESTTVHWHGIDVPNEQDGVPDITQDQIKPGATYTYEFTVHGPAVGMYHAHSNSQHQVPMGLSAGMIVAALPVPAGTHVSQEIPFVLNDAGELGFSINGKAFPATKPITAKVGETILVHYFNEGLQVHPMHLHGPRQLVIAKDGNPLPAPYYADTVLVGPGERYSVLVTPNRPGTWVWHCHILTHAEAPEGFIGMTTALIVS